MKYRCWNFSDAPDGGAELRIDGEIILDDYAELYEFFGVNATNPKSFTQELKQHAGKDITVWINSYGGECTAASLIYTQLMEHTGKVTVKIDGVAVSAASVIAMAGETVLMSPTSTMMIHNPATYAEGDHKEMEKAAQLLGSVKESLINAYELKTGLDRKTISKMMEQEKWMDATEAVELGFANGVLYQNEQQQAITPGVLNNIMESNRMIYNRLSPILEKPQMDPKQEEAIQAAKATFDFIKLKNIFGGVEND